MRKQTELKQKLTDVMLARANRTFAQSIVEEKQAALHKVLKLNSDDSSDAIFGNLQGKKKPPPKKPATVQNSWGAKLASSKSTVNSNK